MVFALLFSASTIGFAGNPAALAPAQVPAWEFESMPAPVFDAYDIDRSIRDAVGTVRDASNLAWLRANLPQYETVEQTVSAAVDAAMKLEWGLDPTREAERQKVGLWAMLAAGQLAVDRFPDDTVLSSTGPFDPTPIERYCECLGNSMRACGCNVISYGSQASCEIIASCPGYSQGSCYYGIAANMCAAQSIIDIISPLR